MKQELIIDTLHAVNARSSALMNKFEWVGEEWLRSKNTTHSIDDLIKVAEMYKSLNKSEQEKGKDILSTAWFSEKMLSKSTGGSDRYRKEKWSTFQDKMDEALNSRISAGDPRSMPDFVKSLDLLHEINWIDSDHCGNIAMTYVRHGMGSDIGRDFWKMYFEKWGGTWESLVKIKKTSGVSGMNISLSTFDIGNRESKNKFPLSIAFLAQSVSYKKFVSNFELAKKYGILDSKKSNLWAGWLTQVDPKKDSAVYLLEEILYTIDSETLKQIKSQLSKNCRNPVAADGSSIIEKLEFACLSANAGVAKSTSAPKNRYSI